MPKSSEKKSQYFNMHMSILNDLWCPCPNLYEIYFGCYHLDNSHDTKSNPGGCDRQTWWMIITIHTWNHNLWYDAYWFNIIFVKCENITTYKYNVYKKVTPSSAGPIYLHDLRPVSISDKTSYRKISCSLETARLVVWIIALLCDFMAHGKLMSHQWLSVRHGVSTANAVDTTV